MISLVLPIPNDPKPLEVTSTSRSPDIFESLLFWLIGIIESGTLLTREKLMNGTTPLLEANKIKLSLFLSSLKGVVYRLALPFSRKINPLAFKSSPTVPFILREKTTKIILRKF